jgi:hypothetical protein
VQPHRTAGTNRSTPWEAASPPKPLKFSLLLLLLLLLLLPQ